jgi:hypothetical protein
MPEKQIETVVDEAAVAAAATEEMFDKLSGTYVLPQAQLDQLVRTGHLVSVTTFADHMRPDVHWIEPEEYGKAFDAIAEQSADDKVPRVNRFDEIIAGADDMAGNEAAFTTQEPAYPGYINATLGLDEMVITVRSNSGEPNVLGGPRTCGPTAQVRIPLEAWDAFLVQAQRVRAGSAA